MNSLFVIAPYDYEGLWVFDDARVGLEQEPFVGGTDTMIDAMVAHIPDAKKGFRIISSASEFPGYTQKLDWVRPEKSGNVYRSAELEMEGWLCPALFKYFTEAPAEIYLKVEAKLPAN
ncbi:MAG: DUF6717 family protein [Janthinobacterium lividum]